MRLNCCVIQTNVRLLLLWLLVYKEGAFLLLQLNNRGQQWPLNVLTLSDFLASCQIFTQQLLLNVLLEICKFFFFFSDGNHKYGNETAHRSASVCCGWAISKGVGWDFRSCGDNSHTAVAQAKQKPSVHCNCQCDSGALVHAVPASASVDPLMRPRRQSHCRVNKGVTVLLQP